MVIKADRNLNLHTKTYAKFRDDQQGLVFVPANMAVMVPDDVTEHPLFNVLVKAGVVTVLGKGVKGSLAQAQPVEERFKANEEPLPDPEALGKPETDTPKSLVPQAQAVNEDDVEDEDEDEDEEEEKKKTPPSSTQHKAPEKPAPTPVHKPEDKKK